MSLQIIVDRVGNTNIFNIIENTSITNPLLEKGQSLQSVIDDDLLSEYLEELNRIANISRSLSTLPKENEENQALVFQHLNLNSKLKQIGETIFDQFFPIPLQNFLKKTENTYLFFHIDIKLASLPIEILHDGTSFLWERFYLGKSVKGLNIRLEDVTPKKNLNMLIIADPTEDLEWACKEGEAIFENLSSNFPEKKLNIELLGGRSITKLSLLNSLKEKDIIHYSGHLHYSDIPEENGWLLYDKKIIHAREVQNSGISPCLIFSNSCISGRSKYQSNIASNWYTAFASSFIKSGQTNYIGTNWELPDREPTLDFTIQFYTNLLKGDTLGKALQQARSYSRENYSLNDLTWASYLLIGNPLSRIFKSETKIPDITQNILDYDIVLANYPFPIAQAADEFHNINSINHLEKEEKKHAILDSLLGIYQNTIFFLGAVVIANYKYLNLPTKLNYDYPDLNKTLDTIYEALNSINTLKVKLLIPKLLETLYVHKENLYKMAKWYYQIQKYDKLTPDTIESYIITTQYLLEGFLMSIEYIKNYGFYRIVEPGHRQLSLIGTRNNHRIREIILPTQANSETQDELLQKTNNLIGNCVFYNPIKKIFLDLSPYMDLNLSINKKERDYKIQFKTITN